MGGSSAPHRKLRGEKSDQFWTPLNKKEKMFDASDPGHGIMPL
jgi:hypothetical protein